MKFLWLLCGVVICSGYSCNQDHIQPNLLFVFSDQHRKHAVGFMKEDPVITPNLDQLASEGMAFTNAISSSPICTPMRASLLTGMYPHSNGVLMNGDPLGHGQKCIGEVFKEHGYQTGYIGKWHLWKAQFVPPEERHGFDFWHANNYNGDHFHRIYWRDEEKPYIDERGWNVSHEVDVAIEYIEEALTREAPFVLFVSHHPPHSNSLKSFQDNEDISPHPRIQGEHYKRDVQFVGPESFMEPYYNVNIKRRPNVPPNVNGGEGGFAIEACPGYFGMVNAVDHEFGRLMEFLEKEDPRNPGMKLRETTIVVFTADHGEMLGSHELMFKDIFYEESIGVPFIISWPGHISAGKTYKKIFNTVDIMPTLLSLMDLPVPESVQGHDYSPVLKGKRTGLPETAYTSYFTGWWDQDRMDRAEGYWRAVRTDRYTYVVGLNSAVQKKVTGNIYTIPRELGPVRENEKMEFLFDNRKDPYQMNPIQRGSSEKYDQLFNELRSELKEYLVMTSDPWKDDIDGK